MMGGAKRDHNDDRLHCISSSIPPFHFRHSSRGENHGIRKIGPCCCIEKKVGRLVVRFIGRRIPAARMNSPQHYTEINSRRRSYSSSTTSHNNANNNNNNNNRDFNNNISSSHRRSRVRGRRSFSTEQQLSTDRRLSPLQVVVSTAATTSPPVRHPNESSDPQQQQQYGTRITPSVAATTTATTTYPPAIYTHRSRPPPVNVKHQQGLVSPYLVQLSDSCRAHRTVAHSSSSSFHNTDTDNDDNNNTMTDACRHDLMALQRLLPTVEASVRSSVEPTTNTSIKPLCDFYIQSLSSGNHGNNNHWFCPHAPEQLWSHTRHSA